MKPPPVTPRTGAASHKVVLFLPSSYGRSKAGAPPFSTIAQSPGFNGDRLARLMLSPHPNMAKLALSRTAVDDIAAYILSLKK